MGCKILLMEGRILKSLERIEADKFLTTNLMVKKTALRMEMEKKLSHMPRWYLV